MDAGTIALIVSPILGLVGILVGALFTRISAREGNETERFGVFTAALERRLERAEARIAELERSDSAKSVRIAELGVLLEHADQIMKAQARYIRKLLRLITTHLPDLDRAHFAPDADDEEFIDTGESPPPPPPGSVP